ncbi:MAG: LLM class flavin-dependent oxidoreductase [Cytophagaceae bacterium]|nr:LLM class flavin-dependent oxidoreductase [Cytophagaceae bacterium]|tara:strand:- start:4639 stop:5649 length:1011 start_codon:yes stop_codon:yes gene_type:complete
MTSQENTIAHIKYSVLDLVPALQGHSHQEAMRNSLDLAQHVEQWGYNRFWVSEHHNMVSVISSATVVLLTYLATGTKSIKIGSGGIMLPNHAPLIVAEQFGTLETLFPGRIDLGLGRAPGTDQLTANALRQGKQESVQDFPNAVQELQYLFSKESEDGRVRAIPGEGLEVPIYLLGSSTFSAQLAAKLGLPYAFASHFAPTHLFDALAQYRKYFSLSAKAKKPYTLAAVNIIAADTDKEAQKLATSLHQMAMGIITGQRHPLPPPVDSMEGIWNHQIKAAIESMMHYTFVGSKETIKKQVEAFVRDTQVDELIAVSHIYDHEARLKSFKLFSEIFS